MISIQDKYMCSGCHACAEVCPKNCIRMEMDEEGFLYPKADAISCVNCGLCDKICPVTNGGSYEKAEDDFGVYAACSKDEKIRMESSSGGVFTEIAKWVLEQEGVVFGAAFDENFNVHHVEVGDIDALTLLRGSKYVQSEIGTAYSHAKNCLEQRKWVLFTGTPCQIEGLYAYLGKDYEKLITQDIICHGVPSGKIWNKYLAGQKEKGKSEISAISFRHKEYGWKNFSMHIQWAKDEKYIRKLSEDLYMKAFLSDLCLRPSCYQCAFKGKHRRSDFTLADFWGIQYVLPEMDDDKGTSLVVINSAKGKVLFEQIKERLVYKETELDEAVNYNSAMVKSAECPKNREKFMKEVDSLPFDVLVKKYGRNPSLIGKVIRRIKKLLRG